MKKRKSEVKERRVYFGICHVDGKRYQTYKRSRVRMETCSKHRKEGVGKDQIPMFQGVSGFHIEYSED